MDDIREARRWSGRCRSGWQLHLVRTSTWRRRPRRAAGVSVALDGGDSHGRSPPRRHLRGEGLPGHRGPALAELPRRLEGAPAPAVTGSRRGRRAGANVTPVDAGWRCCHLDEGGQDEFGGHCLRSDRGEVASRPPHRLVRVVAWERSRWARLPGRPQKLPVSERIDSRRLRPLSGGNIR